ncbi:MAG: hypothetical protein AAGA75_18680 [Cyanobacteria bacterium P01_E01_bin.6]
MSFELQSAIVCYGFAFIACFWLLCDRHATRRPAQAPIQEPFDFDLAEVDLGEEMEGDVLNEAIAQAVSPEDNALDRLMSFSKRKLQGLCDEYSINRSGSKTAIAQRLFTEGVMA